MTINDLLVSQLQGSLKMFEMTVADFTEGEFLSRPVPTANHANWQLGHLIKAETNMLKEAGAAMPALPAGFAEKYSKSTAPSDDAAKFLTKEQLVSMFTAARTATIEFAKRATPEQLGAPAAESIRFLAATVADVVALQGGHTGMHVGQIQVLRRKLGKPILF